MKPKLIRKSNNYSFHFKENRNECHDYFWREFKFNRWESIRLLI